MRGGAGVPPPLTSVGSGELFAAPPPPLASAAGLPPPISRAAIPSPIHAPPPPPPPANAAPAPLEASDRFFNTVYGFANAPTPREVPEDALDAGVEDAGTEDAGVMPAHSFSTMSSAQPPPIGEMPAHAYSTMSSLPPPLAGAVARTIPGPPPGGPSRSVPAPPRTPAIATVAPLVPPPPTTSVVSPASLLAAAAKPPPPPGPPPGGPPSKLSSSSSSSKADRDRGERDRDRDRGDRDRGDRDLHRSDRGDRDLHRSDRSDRDLHRSDRRDREDRDRDRDRDRGDRDHRRERERERDRVELGKKRDSSRDVQTQKSKNTSPWGGDWVEYTTDEGRKYYHNAATGVTRWHIPTFDLAAQLSAKAADRESSKSSHKSSGSSHKVSAGGLRFVLCDSLSFRSRRRKCRPAQRANTSEREPRQLKGLVKLQCIDEFVVALQAARVRHSARGDEAQIFPELDGRDVGNKDQIEERRRIAEVLAEPLKLHGHETGNAATPKLRRRDESAIANVRAAPREVRLDVKHAADRAVARLPHNKRVVREEVRFELRVVERVLLRIRVAQFDFVIQEIATHCRVVGVAAVNALQHQVAQRFAEGREVQREIRKDLLAGTRLKITVRRRGAHMCKRKSRKR
jgi:hypothetical protein